MTQIKEPADHVPKGMSVIGALESVCLAESLVVELDVAGSLILLFDQKGALIEIIEGGIVRENPYCAMDAAQRVADRLAWR